MPRRTQDGWTKKARILAASCQRLKQRSLAANPLVAAEESFPSAPAAAACDERRRTNWMRGRVARDHTRFGLRHEIRSIRDELRIHAINACQRAFNLGRRVVSGLQSANRGIDQGAQYRNIFRNSGSYTDVHGCARERTRSLRLSAKKAVALRPPANTAPASTSRTFEGIDQPEMNSDRDACSGCKTTKPVFLLFRLVESSQLCQRYGQ